MIQFAPKCSQPSVYPRVCGGNLPACAGEPLWRADVPRRGSIPACAGEPSFRPKSARPGRVYPRVCGGTERSTSAHACNPGLSPRVRGNFSFRNASGLSPRVRGNHLSQRRVRAADGSIPACAGEGVYPRVCGGTVLHGLSPRVRGNRCPPVRGNLSSGAVGAYCSRSIPACAGEP